MPDTGDALYIGLVPGRLPVARLTMDKTGRNEPCPSGAGVEFKKCLRQHSGLSPQSSAGAIWWGCARWQAVEPDLDEFMGINRPRAHIMLDAHRALTRWAGQQGMLAETKTPKTERKVAELLKTVIPPSPEN